MERPLCAVCNQRPASINYKKNNKTYYRKKCDGCIRDSRKIKKPVPKWSKDGYTKKLVCDMCAFKAKWHNQLVVYYTDGNMNNTKLINLKSICLNCTVVIEKQGMPWVKDG